MNALQSRQAIQEILCVPQDGKIGPHSLAALHALIDASDTSAWPVEESGAAHSAQASSFADPADVQAYKHAIAEGKTELEALAVGDNGIGFWKDDTKEGSGPSCALSPEMMIATWGSEVAAHLKPVRICGNGRTVTALVKDTLPHNSLRIDLNPDCVRALGWEPPLLESVTWAALPA
jgi:hypothetical protein